MNIKCPNCNSCLTLFFYNSGRAYVCGLCRKYFSTSSDGKIVEVTDKATLRNMSKIKKPQL